MVFMYINIFTMKIFFDNFIKYFKKNYYLSFLFIIFFSINYYYKLRIFNHDKLNNNIINLIYNSNLSVLNKINIYNKKIVIYSALFGNYDAIPPIQKQNQFDYFLFTNIIIKTKTNWTLLKIPNIVNNLNMNIVKKQRFIKLHPHLFFKNYDLSIYLDTNLIIYGNITEFLERLLTPKYNIYIFEHPLRNCIYSEILVVIKYKKEKKDISMKVQKRYKMEQFPQKIGLSENCLIIRRHNKKNCINLMEKWWEEIKRFSKRDQLSLNYVLWKSGIKIKYISKKFGLNYFSQKFHL